MALGAVRGCGLALFLFVVLAVCGQASAQSVGQVASDRDVSRVEDIDAASRAIAALRDKIENNALGAPADSETELRDLRDGARRRLASIERELETVRTQMDLLGPAPGENDLPEGDFIAAERSTLEGRRALLNGQRTRALANIYETGDLLTRISGVRVGALYSSLIERGPSPVFPAYWEKAASSAAEVSGRISKYFGNWSAGRRGDGSFGPAIVIIFGALAVSLVMFGPVNRWVMSTFAEHVERRKPSPSRRIIVAGLKMAARTAPGIVGGLIIIETLRTQGVLTGEGEAAARAFWIGVLAILIVTGFTAGFFSTSAAHWRIAPQDAGRGRAISQLALAMVLVFSLKILLAAIGVAAKADESLIRMIEAAASLTMGAILFLLCRTGLWRVEAPESAAPASRSALENAHPGSGKIWRLVRRLGRALSVLIIVAALAGYIALADFIATRICFLALTIGLAWLLRAMLSETAWRMRARIGAGQREDGNVTDEEPVSKNFRFWSKTVINIVLGIALAPAVLILFGAPAEAVRDIAGQALFGFNVGGVHIPSVAKLLSAIVVFIAVMMLTRLVQAGIQRGPLAHSRADVGVQNSLITLLGYAGLVVALFLSISTLGFDLGNLALIAGALSVGIGFGLQSIVNNFVSGLILLFERPIKVGDWIVTSSGEGTVKKISVRSTEVETFDRSSIIIPNSELISSTVTNWTHKNKLGRITVPVGVSYDADPEQVREILLSCAKSHPLIVAYPEPFAVWMDFGASSLDFELRAYLNDISKGLGVRSDLRFAIFKALEEAGISIPFPQRDVHIKSMPEGTLDRKGASEKESDSAE